MPVTGAGGNSVRWDEAMNVHLGSSRQAMTVLVR